MKRNIAKYVTPFLSFLMLVGCANNAQKTSENPPIENDPAVEGDPDDEDYEEVFFDTSVGKEVSITASYLDEVPYLLSSDEEAKKGRARPINTDGIPQDEEGFYDITNPLPGYLEEKWGHLDFVKSWYEGFDSRLNAAKKLKDEVFVNCHSLNEWSNDRLMLFDPVTKRLDFCKKRYGTIYSSSNGAHDYLFLDRGDVVKDEDGKIRFRFSECEINLDVTGCDPIPHQNNVVYVEGSHYICSQTNREYKKITKDDGSETYTLFSEGSSALYIDLKNEGMVYHLGFGKTLQSDGKTWGHNVRKTVYDLKNGYSVIYSESGKQLDLYDEGDHTALTIYGGSMAAINLYDFDGWDSFFIRSLDSEGSFDRLHDIKFKLSNGNVNKLNLFLDVSFRYRSRFDPETNQFVEDYFCGYPELYFPASSYESFESYLELAGLSYKGKEEGLSIVKEFFDGGLQHFFLGEKLDELPDEVLAEFVKSVCDDYLYSEIEEILNLTVEPIPLGTNIMERLFEVKSGPIFDEKSISFSEMEVLVKDNPYLIPDNQYECFVELVDSNEQSIGIVSKAVFTYQEGEKLRFKDIDLGELVGKLESRKHGQTKYYLALSFNGFRQILPFGEDKTKANVDFHDHKLKVDQEGNFQVFVFDGTLSMKAKEGEPFLIKVKCDLKIAKGDEITVDFENHTVTYRCEECGEIVVFNYLLMDVEVITDPETGNDGEGTPEQGE